MSSFFAELKRRNVIRVGLAYVIVAWLLAQAGEMATDIFEAPAWVAKMFVVFLALGFPLAVFFAWAFELTPEGLKREKEVDRATSITAKTGRKLDRVIIAVLALGIGLLLFDKFVWEKSGEPTEAISETDQSSIAVLPFTNRSAREDDAFFVDGIHDDVLTQLARIGSLKVISRTSVMEYRDTTKNMKAIGDELGVATILEGAVQRAGDRVRINVQLIDAGTDEHLWADTYDRQLSAANIFAIQSEIATAIASALQAALSPEEQQRLASVPTENLVAYESYMLGKQKMHTRRSEDLAQAVNHFKEAIALDPEFALAYVGLADSYRLEVSYSGRPSADANARAEIAAAKALELDPQLGEAHTSLAGIAWRDNDYETSDAEFKRGIELSPNYATTYHWYGMSLADRGRIEEAVAAMGKAAQLDPLSTPIQANIVSLLKAQGRFDESLARVQRMIELSPDNPIGYRMLADHHGQVRGRLDDRMVATAQAVEVDPDSPIGFVVAAFTLIDLNDDEQVEELYRQLSTRWPDSIHTKNLSFGLHVYRGENKEAANLANALLESDARGCDFCLAFLRERAIEIGQYADSRNLYLKGYPELFSDSPDINAGNYWVAIGLAHLSEAAGENEFSDRLLDGALEVVQELPRLGDSGTWIGPARIYALQGRTEEALAEMRKSIDMGWRSSWRVYFDLDGTLASLHDEPEWKAMRAEIEADMATQLARVHAMQASGELVLPQ